MKIILLSLLYVVNAMFFTVNSNDIQCITQTKHINDKFNVIFSMSGEEENNNIAKLKDPDDKVLWQTPGKATSTFSTTAQKVGKYSFCVENYSRSILTVTFEFPEEDEGKKIITVNTIENLHFAIDDISKKMDMMQYSIRNGAVRREKHSEISNAIKNKITWYTSLKVLFLVMFSVFQIMMVTSIFNKVKIVNKISMNSSKGKDKETSEFL